MPVEGEQRRQQDQRAEHREADDHDARDRDRAEHHQRKHEQRRERNRDREARDQDRVAGGLHRAREGAVDAMAEADLLAEARHDEQRIIDGEADADDARDVEREDRDVEEMREHAQPGQRRRDREGGDGDGKQRRGDPAEKIVEKQHDDRRCDQLAAGQVAEGSLLGEGLGGKRAPELDFQGRAGQGFAKPGQRRALRGVVAFQGDEDDGLRAVFRDHRDEARIEIRGHRLDRFVFGESLEHGLDLVVELAVEGAPLLAREDRNHVGRRDSEALVEGFLRLGRLAVQRDEPPGLEQRLDAGAVEGGEDAPHDEEARHPAGAPGQAGAIVRRVGRARGHRGSAPVRRAAGPQRAQTISPWRRVWSRFFQRLSCRADDPYASRRLASGCWVTRSPPRDPFSSSGSSAARGSLWRCSRWLRRGKNACSNRARVRIFVPSVARQSGYEALPRIVLVPA